MAIPAVWAYNYFTTKHREPHGRDDVRTSKELIDYLIKSVGSEFGRSIFTEGVPGPEVATKWQWPYPRVVAPGEVTNANINVTPMIDVMLVLLIIFFMIVAPLLEAFPALQGLPCQVP